MENTDTVTGGEPLSIDAAVERLVAAEAPPDLPKEQAESNAPIEDDADDETLEADADSEHIEGDDDGEEEQAEDDEEEEPETSKGRFAADNAKVRLEDGTIASIADLKKGTLLHADYTRKTQEVAEQRKAVETQSAEILASKQQLEQMREYNISLIRSIVPQAPPDPAMLETDPMGYMTQKAQFEQWAQHLQYLEAEQQRTHAERQAQAAETERQTADREWNTLLNVNPSLKDPKRADAFVSDLRKAGEALGFKPDEMKAIALDHRMALALDKAAKWDKLQANKARIPAKVEGRPPVKTSGKRMTPDAMRTRDTSAAMDRLKSTGSMNDAVQALLATSSKG